MSDGLEKYEALAQELLGDDDEAAFAIRELVGMVRVGREWNKQHAKTIGLLTDRVEAAEKALGEKER
jgi:hypothetical protein